MAERVSELQEWLQQHSPGLGCVAQELYRWEFNAGGPPFQCRIILLQTTQQWADAGYSHDLPWSDTCSKKKEAKGEAAGVALGVLMGATVAPHDPHAVPLALHVHVAGLGGGGEWVFFRGVDFLRLGAHGVVGSCRPNHEQSAEMVERHCLSTTPGSVGPCGSRKKKLSPSDQKKCFPFRAALGDMVTSSKGR